LADGDSTTMMTDNESRLFAVRVGGRLEVQVRRIHEMQDSSPFPIFY